MCAQVAAMVRLLQTRDDLNWATDEIVKNLSEAMMQVDFARNRLVESLDERKMRVIGDLYVELACKLDEVGEIVVKITRVVER